MPRVPATYGPTPDSSPASRSPRMSRLMGLAELYAPIMRPIVIVGGVGSGKSWLAERIYRLSNRPGSFHAVSVGDMDEPLLRDTLFGHLAGAYTGAIGARVGLIEAASDGTLLIDDVALMPSAGQFALLQVLATGHYLPIGASSTRRATARFLFGSTAAPRELVERGVFLPDLASCMGEFIIAVPGLADRSEDIVPLAVWFAERFLKEQGRRSAVELTPECQAALCRYPWPENVRELKNVVEVSVTLAGLTHPAVVVRPEHLPERILEGCPQPRRQRVSPGEAVLTVVAAGGNQSEAGRRLGVHRNTIRRKTRKLVNWSAAPPPGAHAPGRGAASQEAEGLAAPHNPSSDNDDRGS